MKKNSIIKVFRKNKTFQLVVGVFCLLCVLIAILCFRYYKELQNTVSKESEGYLQEISKQISNSATKMINDNFAVLGTVSTVIKNTKSTTFEELRPIILEQQRYWNCLEIMLIDANGNSYNAYGESILIENDGYLTDAISGGKNTMSMAQPIRGEECILFVIPLENVFIDGTQMKAIASSYRLTTFDQMLSISSFDGKGYAYLIKKDGSIVIRSSSENAPETGYNILNSVADTKEFKMEKIKSDIKQGRSGIAELTIAEEPVYMAYTPITKEDWYLLSFVPTEVVNAKSQSLLSATLLICVIITLVFGGLLAYLMFSTYRHRKKLEQIAYVDPITGGNTIQKFYQNAEILLKEYSQIPYALVYINIEKFKVLNEQFGKRNCDSMLRSLYKGISDDLRPNECIGRLVADNFCALLEYQDRQTLCERAERWYQLTEQYQKVEEALWLAPMIEFGVYCIINDTVPLPQMVDRAKMALNEVRFVYSPRLCCAIYDDAIGKRLFREKQLEDKMEESLKTGEFEVYLQPKYRTANETIGGAEALVRWKNKEEGMIYPDEFISLFEKNGFITQLDLWVFQRVCETIRKWMDQGREPVKVSVNCSRVQLKYADFLDQYVRICESCQVPPKWIEIELTENVVFENVENLKKIIDQIHAVGFGCSMDDFGSGYSSLNMIQDIPVDTIKLDKVFFRNKDKDLSRTKSVVGSFLQMAEQLHMETVAEGVEEKAQVEMLRELGCVYIQGYYFAKPMPIGEFEELLFGQ